MSKPEKAGLTRIAALLKIECINLQLTAHGKNDALLEVATLLNTNQRIANFDAFFREILERERVSNTALGHDVAIPHARTEQCTEILVAVGRSAEGIEFEAKDGQPVRLIFLIGTPKQMVTEYLRVVGNLARLLRQDTVRQQLLDASDPARFIEILDKTEG